MKIVTSGKKYRAVLGTGYYVCLPMTKKDEYGQPIDYDTLEEAKQGVKDNTWVEVE